ncbi:chloride/fluoride channel protein [Salmonella enterica subsp. enterica serovar Choleraesuis]|nr:chloride/fluoride channel protein [Salmonella enterica subsp. enterica serovar Choleraesuis]
MLKISKFEQVELLPYMGKWLVISSLIAILAGSASAGFLLSLESATQWREAHRWLIWLLPVAGLGVGLLYNWCGKSVDAGNNLIIDEVHDPKNVIPLRMAPLVLIGTLVSHLFGASVGREGTAVQMGGALADQLTRLFRLKPEDRRILLMAGMSAGFSSVFGTPLSGAFFGLEVLAIGRMRYDALFPCLFASVVANQVCLFWGVHHTAYAIGHIVPLGLWSTLAVVIAGVAFGITGMLFSTLTQKLGRLVKSQIGWAPLRPLVGGALIAVLVWALDAWQFTGLGVPEIVRAFQQPVAPWEFAGKMFFTVLSLGTGFKGGEVTPLFYIGATLGNALAPLLHMPFAMMAGIGFVAVFAGAANTPVATTFMAIELFGADIAPLAAIGCFTAYLFSGHTGIYHAQRIGLSKTFFNKGDIPQNLRISELPAFRKQLATQKPVLADEKTVNRDVLINTTDSAK